MIDSMSESPITAAKRRILDRLKRSGPLKAAQVAESLGLTDVAIRQHLLALESRGLVDQAREAPHGRGRPATLWSISSPAWGLFPDHHAELTVGLIAATRRAVGEEGLQRVVACRGEEQIESYRRAVPGGEAPLAERVEALARQRSAEGYMAEVQPDGEGGWLLIEHHCPICEAARSCLGLCSSELHVFRQILGPDAAVERTKHLLSGDDRCVYRVRSRA
jgi:predicted ArsR family transcriptional regulator